jgi:hydroxyethylthiazole kinase-like uncharacterized protein yjeF
MQHARGITRDEAREADRRAIEEFEVPSILLMENAGRACADEALGLLGESIDAPVLVLCGPGNNGGDGLVIARTLWNRGRAVEVVFVGAEDKLEEASADVITNARLWRGLGQTIEIAFDDPEIEALDQRMKGASLLVDALFGTGLTRAPRAPWSEVITSINGSGRPVLAVDLPSGLDADSGEVLGGAVVAALTVSFVGPKIGFELAAGPRHCGRVVVAEIGIPRQCLS